jgi:hypothetical protein
MFARRTLGRQFRRKPAESVLPWSVLMHAAPAREFGRPRIEPWNTAERSPTERKAGNRGRIDAAKLGCGCHTPPKRGYCPQQDEEANRVTDARPTAPPPKGAPGDSPEAPPDARLIRVAFPAPLPAGRSAGAEIPGPSAANVALVTLDRPAQLNALSFAMLRQLAAALEALDSEDACRCIVLTGAGERAFAAGADINELAGQTPASLAAGDDFAAWERIGRIRTPIIAAVRGHALGGGCELAMACDMIVAGDDAQFGQPEIKIGVMPGAGGTQRLTRALGKAKAMELILTGRSMTAAEADAMGLVTAVVPA